VVRLIEMHGSSSGKPQKQIVITKAGVLRDETTPEEVANEGNKK
jgi:hypothetical protein